MYKILSKHEIERISFKELLKYYTHLQAAKQVQKADVDELMEIVWNEIEKRENESFNMKS